jgi:hypothetical protein
MHSQLTEKFYFPVILVVGLCVHTSYPCVSSPSYLHVLQRTANLPNRRQLRSSSSGRVEIPVFLLATVGRRSFPVAAAHVWNSLPVDLQLAQSLSAFRNRLKTFLFRRIPGRHPLVSNLPVTYLLTVVIALTIVI